MGRSKTPLLPQQERRLRQMGEQIKLARLRRKLPMELVAQRAGVSAQSVAAVERGASSVAFGIYANVLMALGLQDDILLIAKDDILGRTLQDQELTIPRRAPKRPPSQPGNAP